MFLLREKKWSTQKKNPQSKERTDNKLNTRDTRVEWNLATLVEGKRCHHWTFPASQALVVSSDFFSRLEATSSIYPLHLFKKITTYTNGLAQ